MSLTKLTIAGIFMAGLAGCANQPAATMPPNGIASTGSAGMTGGAAAAPAGAGAVSTTTTPGLVR